MLSYRVANCERLLLLLVHVFRFSFTSFNVSRTLYLISVAKNESHANSNIDWSPLLYINVFTSSDELQQYSVMVEPIENFVLE